MSTIDQGGAVFLRGMPSETLEYSIDLALRPRLLGPAPADSPAEPALDRHGVSPEIAELARRFAGDGSAVEKAERIERFLAAAKNARARLPLFFGQGEAFGAQPALRRHDHPTTQHWISS